MTVLVVIAFGWLFVSGLSAPWWAPRLARRMQASIEQVVTYPVEELRPYPYDLDEIARRNFGDEVRAVRRGELAALQALEQDEAMGGE